MIDSYVLWEYKVTILLATLSSEDVKGILDEYGSRRWELVAVTQFKDYSQFFFKRPLA